MDLREETSDLLLPDDSDSDELIHDDEDLDVSDAGGNRTVLD